MIITIIIIIIIIYYNTKPTAKNNTYSKLFLTFKITSYINNAMFT